MSLGQHGKNLVALGGGQRLSDAAGHHPTGMDAFVGKQFNRVLAKTAQSNACAAKLWLGCHNSEDVACLRI